MNNIDKLHCCISLNDLMAKTKNTEKLVTQHSSLGVQPLPIESQYHTPTKNGDIMKQKHRLKMLEKGKRHKVVLSGDSITPELFQSEISTTISADVA